MSSASSSSKDPQLTIYTGLATVDKSCRYLGAYPQVVKKIDQATEGAKADRLGIFEFGDVSED